MESKNVRRRAQLLGFYFDGGTPFDTAENAGKGTALARLMEKPDWVVRVFFPLF